MEQNKSIAGIRKAVKVFNRGLVDALRDITALEVESDLSATSVHSQEFATPHHFIASLPFTGVVNGEFFLCFAAPDFLPPISALTGSGIDSPENRAVVFSTLQEVVNIAAGEAIVTIKETFGSQTLLTPRLIEGILHYPKMQIFSSRLQTRDQQVTLDAKLALDLMEQDINIQQQKLHEKSIHDDTGLYNKKHFFETLQQLEERAKSGNFPYTILFTDINRLKYVNDTFGHDAGDALIKTACSLLRQAETPGDMSFRIGGDELVMLLPGKTLKDAGSAIKSLIRVMATATIKGTNVATKEVETIEVHLSIGAASSSEGITTARAVLKKADLRMEADKRQWYVANKIERRQ